MQTNAGFRYNEYVYRQYTISLLIYIDLGSVKCQV